jgi:uncharacterized protein YbbK (DUF523 family)/uncharacterized protein YbgA (DUF1722 family)
LGQDVRYDGGDKKDAFLTDTFGRYIDWTPVCPEVEAGMGVPREPVRLVGDASNPLMIGERSSKDWTEAMRRFTERKVRELRTLGISGYILKSRSPSCGLRRVRIYRNETVSRRRGRGLYAAELIGQLTSLPVEEEERLHDPEARENFIERVFAYQRWQALTSQRKSLERLANFHARHKFLLLAHSQAHFRRLDRVAAAARGFSIEKAYQQYGALFMAAVGVHATVKKHCRVLHRLVCDFAKRVPSENCEVLENLLHDFRRRKVPLIIPLTVMRHYAEKYRISELQNQIYLAPTRTEIMLRNHA